MPRKTPAYIAAFIRRVIKDGGSAPHSLDVQRFFKEEIASRGWYTDELRKLAVRFRRQMVGEYGPEFMVQVADKLFRGRILEEKIFAVLMLQNQTAQFGNQEFRIFESWLDRVTSWADHDCLVHYVLGPMILADPARLKAVFQWAKSPNRWRRRASAVGLIHCARKKTQFEQITKLSDQLLQDQEDMVQKGIGWLLRETAKADPVKAIPYLMKIRQPAPRLVLRTACEKLAPEDRERILKTR
ncbi:MAG TPA: DNA alkylation repair protein [Terriglobales bacterium]|nr:DNA alkylation repair protein [Terriglobales bacterium]